VSSAPFTESPSGLVLWTLARKLGFCLSELVKKVKWDTELYLLILFLPFLCKCLCSVEHKAMARRVVRQVLHK